jgi:hypothetical protein
MTSPGTFGRRPAGQPSSSRTARGKPARKAPPANLNKLFPSSATPEAGPTIRSLGQAETGSSELDAWKSDRKRAFRLPWRQLSLIAGLSFGIGSFVLPESVTGVTDWVLYALMAASFAAGLSGKSKKKV